MKPEIHPGSYRKVVFKDMSCDFTFLTQSCVDTKETIQWEDTGQVFLALGSIHLIPPQDRFAPSKTMLTICPRAKGVGRGNRSHS